MENAGEGVGAVSGESDIVFRRNKVRSGFKLLKDNGYTVLCGILFFLSISSYVEICGFVGL